MEESLEVPSSGTADASSCRASVVVNLVKRYSNVELALMNVLASLRLSHSAL